MQNFKFLPSAVPEILGGSQNLKSRSRDPGHAPFDHFFTFFVWYDQTSICMQNFKFLALAVPEILGGSQNLKSRSRDPGHVHF